jgi:hypothetical protein
MVRKRPGLRWTAAAAAATFLDLSSAMVLRGKIRSDPSTNRASVISAHSETVRHAVFLLRHEPVGPCSRN